MAIGGEEIPITKEILLDWLREEVPDGAEMKIEVGPDGQLDLIAFSGNDQYALIMGLLPDKHVQIQAETNDITH